MAQLWNARHPAPPSRCLRSSLRRSPDCQPHWVQEWPWEMLTAKQRRGKAMHRGEALPAHQLPPLLLMMQRP
jgi:hypothetical protein